ncbi:hypothetical protein J2Q11_14095 [Tenacibaculum finnmarkense genomovar finnmarkense]|uniref:M949_RS01915 family surface polysaccharide biosynthesis protein n=1 Tax=Tenacibaculum finnmarkense TaxID=2781243 RepID=UPI00187B49DA|nr:hypothetical protein [Tenacibaculum finnmarkense]MBE7649276.1 hypothetical protein [Tenacibaculum finnmarkense genomovar ulcerans]MCD8400061.1 hypothetical protein [Tenacibaculum finnmarkense genomovar ulcerans]MCD8410161.1 hypothetical protein [Tenacibaculum finnmarkense genomovar ulcerans]MCD8418859.1 hypothetical protein [Tenacibaculum finnmarkense genomovar finnmarkense]MCG8187149.1 hypothetical protein [Tenacibaculum finnmarkense genomovar finnmarkense]
MKKIFITLLIICEMFIRCKQESSEVKTKLKDKKLIGIENIIISKIDSTELPKSLNYNGFIKNSVRWKDKKGENIVITTETGILDNGEESQFYPSFKAELFAYHFIVKENELIRTWKVYDYVKDCPVATLASFIKNTFQVTDLNKNGIAEIWLMYKKTCQGDVSPLDMKIIMYEGLQKFAMRGKNKVEFGVDNNGNSKFEGGEYKFDKQFKNSPEIFRIYALNLWNKNIIENWKEL